MSFVNPRWLHPLNELNGNYSIFIVEFSQFCFTSFQADYLEIKLSNNKITSIGTTFCFLYISSTLLNAYMY